MEMTFKCPHCDQELSMDSSGAGTEIQCPSCTNDFTVPEAPAGSEAPAVVETPTAPPRAEKHLTLPRNTAPTDVPIVKNSSRPLEVTARETGKQLRVKSLRRGEYGAPGKEFDVVVSEFLEKVGEVNITAVHPIQYSTVDPVSKAPVIDYGVLIIYKG